MKVCGFSFIRNAIKYDYPIVEAITSVLPLCDHFVIAVGNSEDETYQLIKGINSDKISLIQTTWDDTLREGGRVLANETDKAFEHVDSDADWAIYIQGDEVLHEKYHKPLYEAMLKWKDTPQVEGLLLRYLHFYGSYDYIGDSRRWYRNEIRVIKNNKRIHSYKDAQGFRIDSCKLKVKQVDAVMFHYGWVKPPDKQQAKQQSFHKLWHDDAWVKANIQTGSEFDYSKIDSLKKFDGTHPKVMETRIKQVNWQFDIDPTRKKLSTESRFINLFEKLTGYRLFEYKNYKII